MEINDLPPSAVVFSPHATCVMSPFKTQTQSPLSSPTHANHTSAIPTISHPPSCGIGAVIRINFVDPQGRRSIRINVAKHWLPTSALRKQGTIQLHLCVRSMNK